MLPLLSSVHNPKVQAWKALNGPAKERRRQGLFLAEGEHMAGEALKAGCCRTLLLREDAAERYDALIGRAEQAHVPVQPVSESVLAAVCDVRSPQGIAALCPLPSLTETLETPVIVALEDVQDPGNVGTVLRTLDALGVGGLLITPGCADPFSPKTLRASMGAVFRVPVCLTQSLPETIQDLHAQGYRSLAGTLDGTPFYARPADAEKMVLLIGNEGAGLTEEIKALAMQKVKLPMRGGAESLNAAVACAVMLYDLERRRLEDGDAGTSL